MHKQLETCALANKTTVACIEILQDEANNEANDEERSRSAYKSLVEIYMTCMNVDRNWLELFRKAFESVVNDQTIRDHCKIYNKYLKILRNLKDYETLLKSSIQMIEIYPREFIPLEMVCWVYVNRYNDKDFRFKVSFLKKFNFFFHSIKKLSSIRRIEPLGLIKRFDVNSQFQEIVPKSVDVYADLVLEIGASFPSVSALIAKGMHLYETENFVAARDYLNRGKMEFLQQNFFRIQYKKKNSFIANNQSTDDVICLRLLADTHLKLHAFTLAEFCYTKTKTINLNYLQSLVEQNNAVKSQEALSAVATLENELTLTDEEKIELKVILIECVNQRKFFYRMWSVLRCN